jgi:hypothetical protein
MAFTAVFFAGHALAVDLLQHCATALACMQQALPAFLHHIGPDICLYFKQLT